MLDLLLGLLSLALLVWIGLTLQRIAEDVRAMREGGDRTTKLLGGVLTHLQQGQGGARIVATPNMVPCPDCGQPQRLDVAECTVCGRKSPTA